MRAVALVAALLGGLWGCAPPRVAPVLPESWPRAPFDYSAVTGPFPPRPVQPLPEPVQAFYYTTMEYDDIGLRFVLDPLSVAVPHAPGLAYASYPVLVDTSVPPEAAVCLPPPPRATPPPGAHPWDGELCQSTDAVRAWLTGQPEAAFVGALPPAAAPPIGGPFGDLEFVGVPGPDWIHFDADDAQNGTGRYGAYYGDMQFEPFSKRLVMTVATLETNDMSFGWRLHGDLDPNFLICVETTGTSGGQHQERCTTVSRLREWLLRYGKPMPPVVPTPVQ